MRIVWAIVFLMIIGSIGAQQAHAAGCMAPKEMPTLRVEIDASKPTIDHTHQRTSLKRFDIATISPYDPHQTVHVNGLMRGAITLKTEMGIAWQRLTSGDDNCYWFNNINLQMQLNPTIFIANEIQPNSCLYQEVLKHEYRHYYVDLEVARDYQLVFQEGIERFMRQTGMIGPFPATMQDQAKAELVKQLEIVIHSINERMKSDRIKRQALIDTREEYERVVNACPGDRRMM